MCSHRLLRLACASLTVALGLELHASTVPAASASTLPAGFRESIVFSGLTYPTAVRFAADGRVFVAEKSGLIKVFDSLSDPSPVLFADLSTNVYNFWDRGLLGLALHPSFPATPYLYVLYAHDAAIGGTAPRWGTPGVLSDPCPSPPGATADGCVVSGRVSRLQASGNTMTGQEEVLVEDWCQQYPSLSVGALAFGADGALYASGGTGSSFTFIDWGQEGDPPNPCGDPPHGVGTALSPPAAEGGSLRGQDLRTSADPLTLDGTIIRVDPATGGGLPNNPLAASGDANARRVVAYGLRNPFRFAIRPGTNEVWLGDVGTGNFEEINRIPNPTDSLVENFGWPCYEGDQRQLAFDAANLNMCESLYAEGAAAVAPPFFAYAHSANVVAGESCPTGSSSLSGLSFYTTGSYPSGYEGALFFADYSRDCIWVAFKGQNGLPDLSTRAVFAAGAASPVDLQIGPGGDLFYVDFDGGAIRRIEYGSTSDPAPPTSPSYASDLTWKSMTNGWGPVEKDKSNGEAAVGDGRTITLNGTTYAKGLGAHAASDVRYNLGGNCARFRSDLGVDDEVTSTRASVVFQVFADGMKLYDSGPMGATSATKTVDVDVTAKNELQLVVTDAGDGIDSDHADWAAAWVECGSATSNTAPTAAIATPTVGKKWTVGETISFSGSATDAEDGTLAPSALSWSLILHHCPANCHTHPLQSFAGVASGSFTTPDHEYPSHLELQLIATDSGGLEDTESVLLYPDTVTLSFNASPSGVQLVVNGTSGTASFTRTVITGSVNTISAPSPQTLEGAQYAFSSWSDGGAQTHAIVANASATYAAMYDGPPRNESRPTIVGEARDGMTLTAGEGGWSGTAPITFAYQWLRCDKFAGNCVAVAGATNKTYLLTSSDVGMRIKVTVTATNSFGSKGATSDATATVKRGRR